jgi:outer membrane receptor protein involved in Fe transport
VGPVSWNVDYTLQFAEGTSSDPEEAFQRFQSNLDDIKVLERLNWDRRHVLNNRITLTPSRGLSITMINRWRTGLPYTTVRDFVTSFQKNNGDQPSAFIADLRVYYSPPFLPDNIQVTALVDNLFDTQVHEDVFASTGRADEDVTLELFRRSGTGVGGVNSLDEFFLAPYRFSEPRRVTVGVLYSF